MESTITLFAVLFPLLFQVLQSYFPFHCKEIVWKEDWFPKAIAHPPRYWESATNRREFMDELWKELRIESPKDWSSVTTKDILSHGGNSLLKQFKTIPKLLNAIYPGNE